MKDGLEYIRSGDYFMGSWWASDWCKKYRRRNPINKTDSSGGDLFAIAPNAVLPLQFWTLAGGATHLGIETVLSRFEKVFPSHSPRTAKVGLRPPLFFSALI